MKMYKEGGLPAFWKGKTLLAPRLQPVIRFFFSGASPENNWSFLVHFFRFHAEFPASQLVEYLHVRLLRAVQTRIYLADGGTF